MKNVMKLLVILFSVQQLNAQSELSKMAKKAYLTSSEKLWEQTVQQAEAQYRNSSNSEDLFAWLEYQYGLLNVTMGTENKALFEKHVDQAEENIDLLIEQSYKKPQAKALLSAISGLKIAYAPWKGMLLGPKSGHYIDEAMAEDPSNAIVLKLMGNYLYFTPEMWGGDLNQSIIHYKKAITAFEEAGATDSWLYLDTLAWLGQALRKSGKSKEAVLVYEKALVAAPDFYWVKEVLLPNAKNS
ncbi:MAG: tetratricopeptide repeat protein [Cyclobacteriaceae bacterium]